MHRPSHTKYATACACLPQAKTSDNAAGQDHQHGHATLKAEPPRGAPTTPAEQALAASSPSSLAASSPSSPPGGTSAVGPDMFVLVLFLVLLLLLLLVYGQTRTTNLKYEHVVMPEMHEACRMSNMYERPPGGTSAVGPVSTGWKTGRGHHRRRRRRPGLPRHRFRGRCGSDRAGPDDESGARMRSSNKTAKFKQDREVQTRLRSSNKTAKFKQDCELQTRLRRSNKTAKFK